MFESCIFGENASGHFNELLWLKGEAIMFLYLCLSRELLKLFEAVNPFMPGVHNPHSARGASEAPREKINTVAFLMNLCHIMAIIY